LSFWVYPSSGQQTQTPKNADHIPMNKSQKIAFKYIGPIKILLVKSTVFKQKVAFF
jgi:hypothetical protein